MAYGQMTKPIFFLSRSTFSTFTNSCLENESEWWLMHKALSSQHIDSIRYSENSNFLHVNNYPTHSIFSSILDFRWNIENKVLTVIQAIPHDKYFEDKKEIGFLWKWNADGTEFVASQFRIHFIAISTDISIDAYVIHHININSTQATGPVWHYVHKI